jgi:DNA-binding transcriptional LysR family regulator
MDRLEAMSMLVAVVEAGSFSAAGRKLGIPLATLSRKVAELETHLNARLLLRSSRKLTLTDAGSAYYASCKQVLDRVYEMEHEAAGECATPRGDIVVTAPIVFGRLHLLPVVHELLAAYPEVCVRLRLSDDVLHLADENIDVAVRIGKLPDSSMVATQVGTVCRVVCGSPEYLATHGRPAKPADLAGHACVSYEALPSGPVWTFTPRNALPAEAVSVKPRLSVSTAEAAIDAAIAGIGLTHVLSYQIAHAVEEQKLQLVLREYEPTPIPVSVMHVSQRLVPGKTRRFMDFAIPRLRQRLLGDKDRLRAGSLKAAA